MSRRRQWWLLVSALMLTPAFGIGPPSAPPSAAPSTESTSAPMQAIATAEPGTLLPRMVRASHGQRLAGLGIDASVVEALANAEVAKAVEQLTAISGPKATSSSIALVRIQRWCVRIPPRDRHRDPQLLEQLRKTLSEAEAARLQTLVDLELDYAQRALQSCQRSQFDYHGIESQLRGAAEAGDPLSITELSRIETRPEQAEALLQQAAEKNYAPAQYALAMLRLTGVQRGERTQNVGTIRVLLKQAGRTMGRAKLDLANCMSTGCEGHPADVSGALVFGLDAARDGERDAFNSIARMPWAARLPVEQRLAWQYFGQQLNEAGCFGEDYLPMYALLRENVAAYEKVAGGDLQSQATKVAQQYWESFSSRAMREQHCAP